MASRLTAVLRLQQLSLRLLSTTTQRKANERMLLGESQFSQLELGHKRAYYSSHFTCQSSKRGFHSTLFSCSRNSMTCTKCSHSYQSNELEFIKLVSCPQCGALQKLHQSNLPDYFRLLDHVNSYRVDVQTIASKTKQLQKKFHPDLYSQKGSEQQDLSQEYSSLINKAMSTLSDPIARGRYMLTLAGLSPEDPNSDIERTMTSDPEFLEDIMELNEKLEEVSSEKEWTDFRNQNAQTLKKIHGDLEKAFEKQNINEAQRLLGRMKYFDTLQHKLKDLQARIGIVE